MAIEEGNPSTLVPDFFNRFTWFERRTALYAFKLRLQAKGRRDSPDESPASVARKAMTSGSYYAFVYYAVFPCVVVILLPATGSNAARSLGLSAAFWAVAGILGALRHRQINRYFRANLPESLH